MPAYPNEDETGVVTAPSIPVNPTKNPNLSPNKLARCPSL